MTDFEAAVKFTLDHEGDLHHDPRDPGGVTNFGISQRAHPEIDVRKLTRSQAIAFYKREYWQRYGCDELEFPLNIVHFESCVNPGPVYAQQWRYLAKSPEDYLRRRMAHYVKRAGESQYIKSILYGLLKRSVDLGEMVFL